MLFSRRGNLATCSSRWVGRSELFGGRQEMQINQKEPEISKFRKTSETAQLHIRKWPLIVGSNLNSTYLSRNLATPLTFLNVKTRAREVFVSSCANKSLLETKTIENALHDNTRGHAVQVLFEGRGVKAYFEPDWPSLKVKLSVGSIPIDFTRKCSMDPDIKGYVDTKNGARLVLHGPTKERVGKLAMEIFRATKARPATGKGSHIACNPPKLIKAKSGKKK
jgi:ribosomal protein L6P/L9E